MKLLLMIADIDEFVPFKKCVERRITEEFIFRGMPAFKFSHKGIEVTALCFGIGKVNAATGAALALSELKFDGVINTGWSGAVSGVAKGDVIVATSFVECDFDMTAIGKLPAQKPGQDIYVYNACGFIYDAVVKANETAADSHAKFKFGALGTGYRAKYLEKLSKDVANGEIDLDYIKSLPLAEAKKELLKINHSTIRYKRNRHLK